MTAINLKRHAAFVSLGSNLGDKKDNCLRGLESLASSGHAKIVKRSRFCRTDPVDYLDQDWFVNAMVKVETDLGPHDLMRSLLDIEAALGRLRESAVRFGPRIIDLDLIFYGTRRIESDTLVVPHPRMHRRRFVLEPICDIEPELLHPVLKKTMRQLLADLALDGQKLTWLDDD